MGKRKNNFTTMARRIVEFIYQGKALPLQEDGMACISPVACGDGRECRIGRSPIRPRADVGGIVHGEYRLIFQSGSAAVIAGRYGVLTRGERVGAPKEWFNISIVLDLSMERLQIAHLHISPGEVGRVYRLRGRDERSYQVPESEILYLEASHNHVLWHCDGIQIETAGSFRDAEVSLSEEFVRIHRSFIVNRRHIRRIDRCYVEVTSGEILQIPVKKYCEVKRRLQREA